MACSTCGLSLAIQPQRLDDELAKVGLAVAKREKLAAIAATLERSELAMASDQPARQPSGSLPPCGALAAEPREEASSPVWRRRGLVLLGLAAAVVLVFAVSRFAAGMRVAASGRQLAALEKHLRDTEHLVRQERLRAEQAEREVERRQQALADATMHWHEATQALATRDADTARRERQIRLGTVNRLAERARSLLLGQPLRGLTLAVEAVEQWTGECEPLSPAMEQLLRDAMAAAGGQGLGAGQEMVAALAFTSDGRRLLTAGSDGAARLWSFSPGGTASSVLLGQHAARLSLAACSADGRWGLVAGEDGVARLCRMAARPGEGWIELAGHQGPITVMATSGDGRWLATAARGAIAGGETVWLWDMATESPSAAPVVLRGHEKPVLAIALSGDGHWLATGSEDNTARVYNLAAPSPGATQAVLRGHEGWVAAVALSPQGLWLATGSYDGTVRCWNLAASDPQTTAIVLAGKRSGVNRLAVSADGRWLAAAGFDATVRLWDMAQAPPAEATELAGHRGRIEALAFTPDNRRLISAADDAMARAWDLTDPAHRAIVFEGHKEAIRSMGVSPDGQWLATLGMKREGSSPDGQRAEVHLWNLCVDGLVASADKVAAGNTLPGRTVIAVSPQTADLPR